MPLLVFKCDQSERVISTGIELDASACFMARAMHCRFCGHGHPWEVVEEAPQFCERVSEDAEVFLRRSIQSDVAGAKAADPVVRELYWRMAGRWFRRAIEAEVRSIISE